MEPKHPVVKLALWLDASRPAMAELQRLLGAALESRRLVSLQAFRCEDCGAELFGKRRRRFCGAACRQRAYRNRHQKESQQ